MRAFEKIFGRARLCRAKKGQTGSTESRPTAKPCFALATLLAAIALPLSGTAAPSPAAKGPETIVKPKELSLVRVNVTGQPYDYVRPWQKKAPFQKRALGAVLPQ